MHGAAGLEFPDQRAVSSGDAIEMLIVGTDQHPVPDYNRRRLNFALRLERPDRATIARGNGVKRAAEVADVDNAALNAWGGIGYWPRRLIFPAHRTVPEAQRHKFPGLRADIDHAIDYGRGRLY